MSLVTNTWNMLHLTSTVNLRRVLFVFLVLCTKTAYSFFQHSRKFEIMDLVGPDTGQQGMTVTPGSFFDRSQNNAYGDPMYDHRDTRGNPYSGNHPVEVNTMNYNNPGPTSNPMHFGNQGATENFMRTDNQRRDNSPMKYDIPTVTDNPMHFGRQAVTTNPMHFRNHAVTTNPMHHGYQAFTTNPMHHGYQAVTTNSMHHGYQTFTNNPIYSTNHGDAGNGINYNNQRGNSIPGNNQARNSNSFRYDNNPAGGNSYGNHQYESNPMHFGNQAVTRSPVTVRFQPPPRNSMDVRYQPIQNNQMHSRSETFGYNQNNFRNHEVQSYQRYSGSGGGGARDYTNNQAMPSNQNYYYDPPVRHNQMPYRDPYINNNPMSFGNSGGGILNLLGPVGPIVTVMPFNSVTEKITTTTEIPDREKEAKPAPQKKKPVVPKKVVVKEKAPVATNKTSTTATNQTVTTAKPIIKTTAKPEVETSAYEKKATTDIPEEREIGEDPTTSADGLTQRTESPHGTDPIEQHDPVTTVAMPKITTRAVVTTQQPTTATTRVPSTTLTPQATLTPKPQFLGPGIIVHVKSAGLHSAKNRNSGAVMSYARAVKQSVTPKPRVEPQWRGTLGNKFSLLAKKLFQTGQMVKSPTIMLTELSQYAHGKHQNIPVSQQRM